MVRSSIGRKFDVAEAPKHRSSLQLQIFSPRLGPESNEASTTVQNIIITSSHHHHSNITTLPPG